MFAPSVSSRERKDCFFPCWNAHVPGMQFLYPTLPLPTLLHFMLFPFPPPSLSRNEPQARANLLHLLVQPSLSSATALTSTVGREGRPGKQASSAESRPSPSPWKSAVFPYLSILLYVDAGAAIDVLSIAMDSPDAVFRETGDVAVPSPKSPASAVPTSFRQSAKVPGGGGVESGNDAVEGRGGVWGKRIGKGRARAIGWAGASATAASGAGAEGGGVGAEGWTERGGGGSSAEVAENVCPSRRTIVEVKRSGRQRGDA